ncbi:hypothetical protein SAY86_008737 [Trapa natans]|uniref:NAB domain-containing protein n=1 Tax=Trapa natans TaxID=22666 RepID=A0AAN7K9W7_TRANT|nr:hypothetical protein SAY86_008737 [Trapa natans]
MAKTVHADSRGMYSWWWDSHISPKNSKWLQENLSDMDVKIKLMIKLIEEDADSFARRAEMYYKKRPELLKLVEEFYRAYRALAERYDYATGVLRQAHRSMAEAFPNQIPPDLDDSIVHVNSTNPEDSFVDNKEFNIDFLGQFLMKEFLKLEAEKEAKHIEYQQRLVKMSAMENDIGHAQEEAQTLKQKLITVEEEKEDLMGQYKMSLETISGLEDKLADVGKSIQEVTERFKGTENEMEILKQELEKVTKQKESASHECSQLSEKVQQIECKMLAQIDELAEKEEEVGKLWSSVQKEHLKSMEAKNATQELQDHLLRSQEEMGALKCFNQDLQEQVRKANEENKNLKRMNLSSASLIDSLRGETSSLKEIIRKLEKEIEIQVEEQNALHQEIYLFKEKMNMLKEKYQPVMEQVQSIGLDPESVKSYVKKLQDEKSKLREFCDRKLRENASLLDKNALLENFVSDLNSELEEVKQKLQDEQSKLREFCDQRLQENATLLEKNALLENSVAGLNSELLEVKQKLQDEKLKLTKFNDDTFSKHADLLEKNAFLESLVSSLALELEEVKQKLQDEKAKLRDSLDKTMGEKVSLLEKNILLEDSVSHSKAELEEVQQKLKASEESLAHLICQLEVATKNSEALEEKSDDLQNSLSNAYAEIERLRIMLEKSEDSWLSFLNEKLALITERERLSYQLDITKRKLEESDLRCEDLERKCSSFDMMREENSFSAELSKTRIAALESRVLLLQQEALTRNREIKDELDKALNCHFEIFILKNCIKDLEEKNLWMSFECHRLTEAFSVSEEQKNLVEKSMSQKVLGLQSSLSRYLDENSQLVIEKSVLCTVLREMQLESMRTVMERGALYEDLRVQSERCILSRNRLQEANREGKIREKKLANNLLQEKHEVELWEAQATDLFCKLMILNIHETVLIEKVHEFAQSNNDQRELHGQRIRFLEEENARLTSKLDKSAEIPWKDRAVNSHKEQLGADSEEIQDIKLIMHLQSVSSSPIDEAAQAAERGFPPESSTSSPKSEDRMREMEGLRSRRHNSRRGNDKKIRHLSQRKEVMKHTSRQGKKPAQHPIHPESEILTKDIVLDQMSEHANFRLTQRENIIGSDDRMLELWETTDLSGSIDLTVGMSRRTVHHPSQESFSSKELAVDKVEVSEMSPKEPHRGERSLRRVLERLKADAQKLTNLQITVQDLKRKVGVTERIRMGRSEEYSAMKEQLEEAEVTILNFFDANCRLSESVQKALLSRSSGTDMNIADHGSGVRRRMVEQARRGSEKIAELQLEVQKMQFLLMKLNDEVEKEMRGGLRTSPVSERKTSVLLKDFLHVRARTNLKKKGQFCCVQLPTRAK